MVKPNPRNGDDAPKKGRKASVTRADLAGIGGPPTLGFALASWQAFFANFFVSGLELGKYNYAHMLSTWDEWTKSSPQLRTQRDMFNEKFSQWVDSLTPGKKPERGASTGGRFYSFTKGYVQQMMELLPEPARSITQWQLMHNRALQDMMRSEGMAAVFESLGRALPGHGLLYDDQYNHKFLTENAEGKIVEMKADDVVKLFPKLGKGQGHGRDDFPHIIMTSSHAQGETEKDVTSITHGIQALARDSERAVDVNGKPIGKEKPKPLDIGTMPGQTLVLYACDVRQNPWLNAASLLRRIAELKRVEETGRLETKFTDISPGAKRIAKLMLKCMVEEPSRIDTDDPRAMHEIAKDTAQPIRLRSDAVEVAHHFQLIGYSKGGNVVSDAMRYLISELLAKDANGKEIFEKHPDSPTRSPDGGAMTPHNVSNIARSIAVMAIAAVEVGLSRTLKDYGVRRVAFNNHHDSISAHHNYEGTFYDERWLIEGATRHNGHAPQDMLGTVEGEIVGYAHDDPRVARRLKEFFAPNRHKAAIGHVHFGDEAANGSIIVEAATGTTDHQVDEYENRAPKEGGGRIRRALEIVGLVGNKETSFTMNRLRPGMFTLSIPGHDFANNKDSLLRLQKAFAYLRADAPGLVITQTILTNDIQKQIEKAANGRSVVISAVERLEARKRAGGGPQK